MTAPKEFAQVVDLFAYQHGLSTKEARDLMLCAMSAYAAKMFSGGKGIFVTKFENGEFETYREWELVADDCVMEDPERQWRVLDAKDEGFDEAEVGDLIHVQTDNIEPSRQYSAWVQQYLAREVAKHKKLSSTAVTRR